MIDFVRVGNTIASLRRQNDLSQEELAGKLFVTRQALSKWENGTALPGIESMIALSKLFGVSIEELLGLDSPAPSPDPENLFRDRPRAAVLHDVLSGELPVDIASVLYQFSPAERMLILRSVKTGTLPVDRAELAVKLTPSEQRFLEE